jgi:hypothetical protein
MFEQVDVARLEVANGALGPLVVGAGQRFATPEAERVFQGGALRSAVASAVRDGDESVQLGGVEVDAFWVEPIAVARADEDVAEEPDLLHLDRYQVACRVCEEGLVLPAATAVTERPPDPADTTSDNEPQAATHGRTKRQVDALIAERFPQLERPINASVAPDADGTPGSTFGGNPDAPPNVPGTPRNHAETGSTPNPDSM